MTYLIFKNEGLSALVERWKELDEKTAGLWELSKERDSIVKNLRENTYEWHVFYELQVRSDKGDRWVDSYEIKGLPDYRDTFVETAEEAMQKIEEAKKEIKTLTFRRVKVEKGGGTYNGLIIDYNIPSEEIRKGKIEIKAGKDEKIIYEKQKPRKVIPPAFE